MHRINRMVLPAKYTGVLRKPVYVALRREVKRLIDAEIADYGTVSIGVNSMPWTVKVGQDLVHVNVRDVQAVWYKIASDLGLYDDGTKTNTWTIKGHELDILPALQKYVSEK